VAIELDPPYKSLTFMSPLSEDRADRLVRFVAKANPTTVLDIGCGWAELLLRVLTSCPRTTGVGVDCDSAVIDHGLELATERGLSGRITLIVGDATANFPTQVDAVVCIGATHVWNEQGAPLGPMNYRKALLSIRSLVEQGSHVIYGEGIWSVPPTSKATAPLAGRDDEFHELGDLVELAVDCGFMPMAQHVADQDEWDHFESGYSACYARWLSQHPRDHPDAPEVRERARQQRASYMGGYRGILGMAYLELVAV
jgi:SAM-dependent methyltransferase